MGRKIRTDTPLGLLRSKMNVTAERMAKTAHVGKSTIYAIEQQRIPMPREIAERISYTYLVDPEWLMDVSKPVPPVKNLYPMLDCFAYSIPVQLVEGILTRFLDHLSKLGKDALIPIETWRLLRTLAEKQFPKHAESIAPTLCNVEMVAQSLSQSQQFKRIELARRTPLPPLRP